MGCLASFRGSPNLGIKPRSPALQADSSLSEPSGNPKNTAVGSLSLLHGIFLTYESNGGLLHCRLVLYQLSYQRQWYQQRSKKIAGKVEFVVWIAHHLAGNEDPTPGNMTGKIPYSWHKAVAYMLIFPLVVTGQFSKKGNIVGKYKLLMTTLRI